MRLVSIPVTMVLFVLIGGLTAIGMFLAGLTTGNATATITGAAGIILVALVYGLAQLIRDMGNAQIQAIAEIADYLGAELDDLPAEYIPEGASTWDGDETVTTPSAPTPPPCGATRRGHPDVCLLPMGHSGPHSAQVTNRAQTPGMPSPAGHSYG